MSGEDTCKWETVGWSGDDPVVITDCVRNRHIVLQRHLKTQDTCEHCHRKIDYTPETNEVRDRCWAAMASGVKSAEDKL